MAGLQLSCQIRQAALQGALAPAMRAVIASFSCADGCVWLFWCVFCAGVPRTAPRIWWALALAPDHPQRPPAIPASRWSVGVTADRATG